MDKIAIEQELCIIPLKTLTVLFSEESWWDAVALYLFYYKQCKLQNTDITWTNDSFIKKWLWWWRDKTITIRKILKKYNLIEIIQKRKADWTLLKPYIKINYYRTTKNQTVDSPLSDLPLSDFTTVGSQDANAYINNNKCLIEKKEILSHTESSSEEESDSNITPPPAEEDLLPNPTISFDVFWDAYGKKVWDKEKCKKKWDKLKYEEKGKILKTLPIFLSRIKDKQFQPHPETYLNQKRWQDELPEIVPWSKEHFERYKQNIVGKEIYHDIDWDKPYWLAFYNAYLMKEHWWGRPEAREKRDFYLWAK